MRPTTTISRCALSSLRWRRPCSLSAGPAASFAGTSSYFETPSKNIVCGYFTGAGVPTLLECGVASGLVPPAPKPAGGCRVVDPASDRVRLNPTGRTYGFCSGDVGVLAEAGNGADARVRNDLAQGPLQLRLGPQRTDLQEHERARLLPQPAELALVLAASARRPLRADRPAPALAAASVSDPRRIDGPRTVASTSPARSSAGARSIGIMEATSTQER